MNKFELIEAIEVELKEVERFSRVIQTYCIDEAYDSQETLEILPALEIIIEKLENINKLLTENKKING